MLMFPSEYRLARCGCGAAAKLDPRWWHKDKTWSRVGCTKCSMQAMVEHKWETTDYAQRQEEAIQRVVDDWNKANGQRDDRYILIPRYTP